jgi:hypothetical protein
MVKEDKVLRTCHRKRQSKLSAHLWGKDMNYRFKNTKELGTWDKDMNS